MITIKLPIQRRFYRSTLVWVVCKGEWCSLLDHKNRDCLDDHIENLRPATHAENNRNRSLGITNKSGYKGVFWFEKRQKWRSQLMMNGQVFVLGDFDDPQEAHAAYMRAAREHFGEFATDGN